MKTSDHLSFPLVAALAFSSLAAQGSNVPNPPFELIATIPVSGWTGRWDHFGGVDLKTNRIFGCSEGGGVVEVFDMEALKHVATIGKGVLHEAHSLTFRADLNRLYVADGTETMGALAVFDGTDYHLIQTIPLPNMADWSEPDGTHIYVHADGSYNKQPTSAISVVDVKSMKVTGKIPVDDTVLTGFAIDPTSPRLYCAMRTKNKVAVVDRESRKVIAQWHMSLSSGMGCMGLDPDNHRLFANCRFAPIETIIIDTQTGKETGSFPNNALSDELIVDHERKRIYIVAAGPKDGRHSTLEAFEQGADPDHYRSLGEVVTGDLAGTGAFVPEKSLFFVGISGNSPAVKVYRVR